MGAMLPSQWGKMKCKIPFCEDLSCRFEFNLRTKGNACEFVRSALRCEWRVSSCDKHNKNKKWKRKGFGFCLSKIGGIEEEEEEEKRVK